MYKSAVSNVYSKKLAKPIPIVYAIKKFATNFQASHVLGAFAQAGSAKNYFAYWSGVDNSTGYSDVDAETFLSATNGPQLQTINDINTDAATLPTMQETSVVDALGPFGTTEKILRFNYKVKSIPLNGTAPTQAWYMFTRYNPIGGGAPAHLNEYYCSYYFKLDPILQTAMKDIGTDANNIAWYSMSEMKTGGYLDAAGAGDYRYLIMVKTIVAGKFRFVVTGDNGADNVGTVPGSGTYTAFWQQSTEDDIPRFGVWCKMEIYLRRPSSYADLSTGITWMAVTPMDTGVRQVICNKIGGRQMGSSSLPATRMFLKGMYTQAPAPIVSDMARLEIHDHFPFSAGVRSINNIMYDVITS